MLPHPSDQTTLVAFDPPTAGAVVDVLTRAGVPAWLGDADGDDVEVRVHPDDRERALSLLASRMEEVSRAVAAADPGSGRRRRDRGQTVDDEGDDRSEVAYDELRDGPPLVMERFRSLSGAIVIVLAPLLVITLASAPLGRAARIGAFVVLATAAAVWMVVRRRA